MFSSKAVWTLAKSLNPFLFHFPYLWNGVMIVVQLLSRVQLFATQWAAAHRASLHCLLEFAQTRVHSYLISSSI